MAAETHRTKKDKFSLNPPSLPANFYLLLFFPAQVSVRLTAEVRASLTRSFSQSFLRRASTCERRVRACEVWVHFPLCICARTHRRQTWWQTQAAALLMFASWVIFSHAAAQEPSDADETKHFSLQIHRSQVCNWTNPAHLKKKKNLSSFFFFPSFFLCIHLSLIRAVCRWTLSSPILTVMVSWWYESHLSIGNMTSPLFCLVFISEILKCRLYKVQKHTTSISPEHFPCEDKCKKMEIG